MRPRVLSIAGVDPSGGAGIIADIKSISAFGGYAMGAVASMTAQNTKGVQAVQAVQAEFLQEQLSSISDDIDIDAVKIGLLSPSAVEVVGKWLKKHRPKYIVLDPVMVATSGDRLLDASGEQKLKELARHATVVTPNLPELAVWTNNHEATTVQEALEQAKSLQSELGCTVLLKLGHLTRQNAQNDSISDFVVDNSGATELTSAWIESNSTHGTGCSLSSALATILCYTEGDVANSLQIAKSWLSAAINSGHLLEVGGKNTADTRISHGPIDHFTRSIPQDFSSVATLLTSDITHQISKMQFITCLTDGSLPKAQFANYLVQDNLYLNVYSDVINKLANIAPSSYDAEVLRSLAGEEIDEEIAFHNKWLADNGYADVLDGANSGALGSAKMSKTTKEYTDFLLNAIQTGDFVTGLSAILPCVLIYARIAQQIGISSANSPKNNPYQMWIDFYNTPDNGQLVRRLIQMANEATKSVDRAKFNHLITIYRKAAKLEIDFFEQ